MTTSVSSSRAALLEQARSLVPALRSRGAEISKLRRLPDDVMQSIADAGLMQLSRPKRYGGPAVGIDTLFEVTRELARGDGSTAWVYVVINSHDLLIGHYPEDIQQEYWNSTLPRSGSSYVPFGTARLAKGGYKLSGKWSFVSGVDFVGWVVVGAIVGMRQDEPQTPDLRYFLLRRSDFEIEDDWDVMGLSGTGSKSIIVNDVFVPDDRILTNLGVSTGETPGSRTHDDLIYQASVWSVLTFALPAIATGVAQGAYDVLLEEFRGRMSKPDPIFHGKRPAIQLHLAEASSQIRCSDLLYMQALRDSFAQIRGGSPLTLEQRVKNRRDTTYSVAMARRATEMLLSVAGARGLSNDAVPQRALRDLYACSVHPGTNVDSAALSFGSVALGGAPTEPYY